MISTSNFKIGMTLALDGNLFSIVDFQHVKPGKGGAFVRTRLKNIKTGAVIDRTFRAGEKVELAHIDRKRMQFLYRDPDHYHFMDMNNYEQLALAPHQMGEAPSYLKEGAVVEVEIYEGAPIGVELPVAVELEVKETDPGLRGDTATGGTKPAVLETGLVVQVPLFVQVGDVIKVDTRTGEYLTRL
jgi:elongation factor P